MKRYLKILSLLLTVGVLFLSSIALASTQQNFAAYLEKGGKILTGITWDDIDQLYELYEMYYGSFDPIFEKPYVEALIINQLLKDKFVEYLSEAEGLSSEEFKVAHSEISESDMEKYYEENREDIQQEAYVDFDYAVFETEEEAKKFYDRASEVGFEKAISEASESSGLLDSDSYAGLKKSQTSASFIDVLFTPSEKKLKMHTTDNASFVFNIKNLNDLSTFEKFKESPMYEEVMANLSNEKFEKYVEEKIKSEKINFAVPQEYKIWFDMVRNVPPEKLVEQYYSTVFNEIGNLIETNPIILTGLLTALEDANLVEEYIEEYEALVRELYELGYRSFLVLARLRQFDNSENVLLEYNVELSKILINYINNGDTLSVLQYIYSNLSELEELSNSGNPEVRQKALEYLYRMNKALGDEESANKYLEQLHQENPNYKIESEQ